jgi:hypothetical protein
MPDPPPGCDETLLGYPYVILRIGCEACRRRGSYRLAILAEKEGASIRLDDFPASLATADGKTRGIQTRDAVR